MSLFYVRQSAQTVVAAQQLDVVVYANQSENGEDKSAEGEHSLPMPSECAGGCRVTEYINGDAYCDQHHHNRQDNAALLDG